VADEPEAPSIDFNTFVLSLGTSGLAELNAEGEPNVMSLALVKQTIDILAMLEEKTKGNLTGEEERLLGQLLFDLRVRYVRAAGRTF
jgi:hypothetical protein